MCLMSFPPLFNKQISTGRCLNVFWSLTFEAAKETTQSSQCVYFNVKQCKQYGLLNIILFLWQLIPVMSAFSIQDTISPLNLSQI